jgi:hypothetical protein
MPAAVATQEVSHVRSYRLYADAKLAHSLVHLAFSARNHRRWMRGPPRGLKVCGCDNGAPGVPKDYSPIYYAAFGFDPDGNNAEAVPEVALAADLERCALRARRLQGPQRAALRFPVP